MNNKLFLKITRDTIPQIKDKYPFIYLEHGRIEIDDNSVKWIDDECNVVRLPIATLNCILLGTGTTITHDAVKTISSANCGICWVGEDGLLFYATGIIPTATSKNFKKQMILAADSKKSLNVVRKMYSRRFPDMLLEDKTLKEMMGMEGYRVRKLYESKADEYKIGWKGRNYIPGKFIMGDTTNKILTAANTSLYGILCSAIHSLGYSPHIGFVHSGSPLPFIYDIADLYKEFLCIDLAFYLTLELAGHYDKYVVANEFKNRILSTGLLNNISNDIDYLFGTT